MRTRLQRLHFILRISSCFIAMVILFASPRVGVAFIFAVDENRPGFSVTWKDPSGMVGKDQVDEIAGTGLTRFYSYTLNRVVRIDGDPDPSLAYNIRTTNLESVPRDARLVAHMPITALAGPSTASAEMTIELMDTNGDGQVSLTKFLPEKGFQRGSVSYLDNRANFNPVWDLGLGEEITTEGIHHFEMSPIAADIDLMADELSLVVDFRLSPGDTIDVSGRIVLDDGTGRPPIPIPDVVDIVSLQAGDADQDLDFDQFDLIQVQVSAKYLTGQAATWGQGDWNGAPGGSVGSPPAGNGLFDQFDIIAAQQAGIYLTGSYVAIQPNGQMGDGQTSIVYDASTGEVSVDAPAGTELTSINIDSAGGIFTGAAANNLGGSFDNDDDANIFKATFGGSFGSLSFGNVAQSGLAEDFLHDDLTVVGSLQGGGGLGDVDLIYVPEPSTLILMAIATAVLGTFRRHR